MKKPARSAILLLLLLSLLVAACAPIAPPTVPPAISTAGPTATPEPEEESAGDLESDSEADLEMESDLDPETKATDPYAINLPNTDEQCVLSGDGTGFTSRGAIARVETYQLIPVFNDEGVFIDAQKIVQENELHGPFVYETVATTLDKLEDYVERGYFDNNQSGDSYSLDDNKVAILVIDEFTEPGSLNGKPQQPIEVEIWKFHNGEGIEIGEILVAKVDIQNFSLDLVANASAEAILRLANDHGIHKFVLNMSWVMAPCDVTVSANAQEYMAKLCPLLPPEGLSLEDLPRENLLIEELSREDRSLEDLLPEVETLLGEYEKIHSIKTLLDVLSLGSFEGSLADLCNNAQRDVFFAEMEETFREKDVHDLWSRFVPILSNTPDLGRLILRASYGYEDGTIDPEDYAIRPYETSYYQLLECLLWGEDINDPVCDTLSEHLSADAQLLPFQFIPIAAAGNLELVDIAIHPEAKDFPYAPALWDSVLSVSADDWTQWGQYVSKRAEVAIGGQYTSPLEGSSFAAARVSVWAAIHLLLGGEAVCSSFPDIVPLLGYSTKPDKSDGKNMMLRKAINTHCPEHSSLLTLSFDDLDDLDKLLNMLYSR